MAFLQHKTLPVFRSSSHLVRPISSTKHFQSILKTLLKWPRREKGKCGKGWFGEVSWDINTSVSLLNACLQDKNHSPRNAVFAYKIWTRCVSSCPDSVGVFFFFCFFPKAKLILILTRRENTPPPLLFAGFLLFSRRTDYLFGGKRTKLSFSERQIVSSVFPQCDGRSQGRLKGV